MPLNEYLFVAGDWSWWTIIIPPLIVIAITVFSWKWLKPFQKWLCAIVAVVSIVTAAWAADTKLSALTELATTPAASDEFYINDGGTSKKIQYSNLMSGNAGTATAFAANGANCAAGQSPIGVDASGAVEGCIDLGATYQPLHASLTSLAGLTETNGGVPYGTADNTYAWLAAGAEGTLLMGNGAGAPSWLAAGTAGYLLVANGAADPVWTASTGTGSPVRATSPTLVTPVLGVASSTSVVGSITLAGNPALSANTASPSSNGIIFEGATANDIETLLTAADPTSADKTITLPNTTGTVYVSSGTDVTVADGGTGRSTSTTAYGLIAAGTTATAAHQTLAAGLTTQILVGGGASALPAWGTDIPTAVTIGSGYIYRAGGTDVPDADVADNITASNYLPLAGGVLTGEVTVDNLGLEFTEGDDHSDCSAFSATGGGIFYDDSEGKFKKCQENVLTDLDTGGGAVATADISDVNVTQTEFAELETIGDTTISAGQWVYLGAMDQGVATTDSPTFAGVTLSASATPTAYLVDSSAAAGDVEFGGKSTGAYDVVTTITTTDSGGVNTAYIEADGTNETLDLLKPVTISNGAVSSGIIDIYEDSDDGSNYTRIQVPAMAANITYTLPIDDGEANEFLQTNGSGVLSWAAGAGSGDVTSVGDCADGACYDGSADGGTYARIYDGDSHYLEINPGDLSADRILTTRDAAGTILISGDTLTGEVTATFDTDGSTATTIADSVTVTGWVLGTSSATQITSPTLITDLIDTTGAADIDIGSADVTDVTIITDGGADSLTIGNNADLDFGITIDSDTADLTINWDEDNEEVELASSGGETLVIDLNTATDQEIGIDGSASGATQINFAAMKLITTGSIQAGITINADADGMSQGEMTAAGMYGTAFFATGAGTWNLPGAAAGMSFCLYSTTAAAIIINPDDADTITYDGVKDTAGHQIASPSAAGDFLCMIAYDATDWFCFGHSGTWVPGS